MDAAAAAADDTIDTLLERYLGLVDEYTRLRAALADLQAGVYQDIARANFAAERGVRYGRDFYDGRARSLRTLVITTAATTTTTTTSTTNQDDASSVCPADSFPRFEVVPVPAADADQDQDQVKDQEKDQDDSQADDPPSPAPTPKPTDPLHWFGLLAVPAPLRRAQARSVEAVEAVVPRLASVAAEMAAVEIQVRRARKRRARAAGGGGKAREREGGVRAEAVVVVV
ncbi:hypothetical protein QBC33DRAFT_557201 [Phialemonium atrogriseum]|uniref:Vacuolar ATPase assembly protein VMA22 n=1 Tax=Phialemonium atrogriseum TaxID=1093897 RepID=A0AAJ0C5K8_9PEZI|nr:uncharacterized protein QBC33DRAFT_557201 [Phialemonium atrogriseum]KAK1769147.1 hypothetical protein QBC33DRAFT_557201 [Phialemonium atrogriseum]